MPSSTDNRRTERRLERPLLCRATGLGDPIGGLGDVAAHHRQRLQAMQDLGRRLDRGAGLRHCATQVPEPTHLSGNDEPEDDPARGPEGHDRSAAMPTACT